MVIERKKLGRLALALMLALTAGCGKKDSSEPDSNSGGDNGGGGDGGGGGALTLQVDVAIPTFSIVSPVASQSTGTALVEEEGAELDAEDPRKVREAKRGIAEADTIAKCMVGLRRARPQGRNAECYGPDVWVTDHHPDGAWPGSQEHMLPRGDLGFMSASEESTGEACAAAKMNSLISEIRERAAQGLEMSLRAGCLARVLKKDLPKAEGETLSIAEEVNAALTEAGIDALKFNKIKMTMVALDGDVKTIKTEIDATAPRGTIWTRVVQKHTSDTESEGYVWGVFTDGENADPNPNLPKNHAFSVIFKESGSTLTYDATHSRVNDDEVSGSKDAVFEDDKRVRVADEGSLGYNHVMTTIDNDTLAGETVYLWTAGSKSEEQRVMHVAVTADGETRTGKGYFGFGKKLEDHRALVKANSFGADAMSIEKMICNWAGPANNHTGTAAVQQQVLTFDTTSGYFKASESHIGYAARNDCGEAASDANFKYKLKTSNTRPPESEYSEWPDYDLIGIDSVGDDLKMPALISTSL